MGGLEVVGLADAGAVDGWFFVLDEPVVVGEDFVVAEEQYGWLVAEHAHRFFDHEDATGGFDEGVVAVVVTGGEVVDVEGDVFGAGELGADGEGFDGVDVVNAEVVEVLTDHDADGAESEEENAGVGLECYFVDAGYDVGEKPGEEVALGGGAAE